MTPVRLRPWAFGVTGALIWRSRQPPLVTRRSTSRASGPPPSTKTSPHRGGMRLGDYTGLPLNEAGIRKGQAWDEDARSMRERQCVPHVVTYAMRGPANIRLSKVVDPDSGRLIAYSLQGTYGRPRTIWMDGRPHPSDLAPHTWVGFSTGKWERNTLVVTTTHVKTGWLQRNGSPTSDLDDDDGVLHSLRQQPARRHYPQRSGVPGRAVHPHDELRVEPDRKRQCVGHVQPGTGGGRAAGPARRDMCLITSRARPLTSRIS